MAVQHSRKSGVKTEPAFSCSFKCELCVRSAATATANQIHGSTRVDIKGSTCLTNGAQFGYSSLLNHWARGPTLYLSQIQQGSTRVDIKGPTGFTNGAQFGYSSLLNQRKAVKRSSGQETNFVFEPNPTRMLNMQLSRLKLVKG